jgi:hypothetical protein
MTKYILKSNYKRDRVLFVQTALTDDYWTVRYHWLPLAKGITFEKQGKRFRAPTIVCGRSAEAVQEQLDAYAKKHKLETFNS